jgi:hypothetical protein
VSASGRFADSRLTGSPETPLSARASKQPLDHLADLIYAPRIAIHGITAVTAEPVSLLSVFAPQFDLARDFVYQNEASPQHYRMI